MLRYSLGKYNRIKCLVGCLCCKYIRKPLEKLFAQLENVDGSCSVLLLFFFILIFVCVWVSKWVWDCLFVNGGFGCWVHQISFLFLFLSSNSIIISKDVPAFGCSANRNASLGKLNHFIEILLKFIAIIGAVWWWG